MKKMTCMFSAFLLAATAAGAQQFVPPDPASITVIGSDRAALDFPRTARLTDFRVERGAMTIHTTGAESWPAVAIDGSGTPVQSATLWIIEKIAGRWYGSGGERLRPEQLNGTKPEASEPGELETLIGSGWFGDPNRWQLMAFHNPAFGEPVCFMIVAGSTRSDNNTPVRARTQIRCIAWPNGATLWDEGDSAPSQPPAQPQPQPGSGGGGSSSSPELAAWLVGLTGGQADIKAALERIFANLTDQNKAQDQKIEDLKQQLEQHDRHPYWLAAALKDPAVLSILSAVLGYFGIHQATK